MYRILQPGTGGGIPNEICCRHGWACCNAPGADIDMFVPIVIGLVIVSIIVYAIIKNN